MIAASASERIPASTSVLITATSPDDEIVGAPEAFAVSAIDAAEVCWLRLSDRATPPFGTKLLVPCAAMPCPASVEERAPPAPKNLVKGADTLWRPWETPTVRKLLPTVVEACTTLASVFDPEYTLMLPVPALEEMLAPRLATDEVETSLTATATPAWALPPARELDSVEKELVFCAVTDRLGAFEITAPVSTSALV